MKMSFGKRLVLFLHWLYSLLICVFAVSVCVSPQIAGEIASLLNGMLGAGLAEVVGIVLLAVYCLLSAGVVFAIFGGRGKRSERGFITVDSSETGRTRIAVGAVDQMIRQAVRGVDGITEMKASITNNQDAIAISCNVGIVSGVHVPTVTMNIQRAIRSYIELNCGVAVSGVSVSVHSMEDAEDGRGRKKGRGAKSMPAAAAPVYPAVPAQDPVLEKAATEAAAAAEPVVQAGMPEAEEECVLPEIEPISLTLDAPEEPILEAADAEEESSAAE